MKLLDRLNQIVGTTISWLTLLLVLIIVLDVVFRYLLNFGSVATGELEWHLFGAIILLSAGWAYQQDRHVRVDLFYQKFSPKTRNLIDLLGAALLLLPFCVVAAYKSFPFVVSSFNLGETSPDPGGLPARFIIKSAIPIGFLLLGLQAISKVISSLHQILKHD